MATVVRISPLDGGEGYPRWKESMLLRLLTARVAHVLSENSPAGDEGAPAAKQWAHDDSLCRGHILATFSDRLFADYVRHATARELWDALARTYDFVDKTSKEARRQMLLAFVFDLQAPLLEQIAHAEALATGQDDPWCDGAYLARRLCGMHPDLRYLPSQGKIDMNDLWRVARVLEGSRGLADLLRTFTARQNEIERGRRHGKPE